MYSIYYRQVEVKILCSPLMNFIQQILPLPFSYRNHYPIKLDTHM